MTSFGADVKLSLPSSKSVAALAEAGKAGLILFGFAVAGMIYWASTQPEKKR